MISKFKGTCRTCGQPIAKGEEITWSKSAGANHAKCAPEKPAFEPDRFDTDYEDRCAEACGL